MLNLADVLPLPGGVASPVLARRSGRAGTWPASVLGLLLATLGLGACGGAYRGVASPGPSGVEAAGLPYSILDGRTGRQVDAAEFWTKLGAAKVVCVGEEHPNPHHHWAQLEVVSKLTQEPQPQLALAMEMFQRPFQGVLDDYAAARIDERALLSRTGWAERWGYDFAMYRPILGRVIKAQGRLVALNPAKELVKRVSRQGLDSLSPQERAALPELRLDDAAHRTWFDGVMAEMGGGGHSSPHATAPAPAADAAPAPHVAPHVAPAPAPVPHVAPAPAPVPHVAPAPGAAPAPDATPAPHAAPAPDATPAPDAAPAAPSADRIYAVQVLWDESMADGAARWVSAAPVNRAVVIAGNGHCHDTAVVGRVKRRGISEVLSVRPIVDTGDDDVAAALAKPQNDYLFVMTMPGSSAASK